MTAIVFAPRKAALDGTEPVLRNCSVLLRPAQDYVDSSGQAVKAIWSDPFQVNGSPETKNLDPLPNDSVGQPIPWEVRFSAPDGLGGEWVRQELRIVPVSGSTLQWESLTLANPPVPVTSGGVTTAALNAAVAALNARIDSVAAGGVGGGAPAGGGTNGKIRPEDLEGVTSLGVTLDKVSNAAAARSAIGAGTSSLAIGSSAGQVPDAAAVATQIQAILDALALRAPLASPALTGNPTAPTPAQGDNDTSIATTAFVVAALAAAGLGGSIQWSNIAGAPSRLMVPVFCLNDVQSARPVAPSGLTYTVVYFKATAPQIGGTIGSGTGAAANDLWRPWNG